MSLTIIESEQAVCIFELQKENRRVCDELARMTGIAAMHRNDSAQYQKDLQNLKSSQQERIAELEDAVIIMHRANKNWRLIVSQDDDFLITRIVSDIESK